MNLTKTVLKDKEHTCCLALLKLEGERNPLLTTCFADQGQVNKIQQIKESSQQYKGKKIWFYCFFGLN